MQFDLLSVILILFGLFTLYGVYFKPNFYWERGRIRRTREIIGDRRTGILYYVAGLLMLAVGVWGIFVGF